MNNETPQNQEDSYFNEGATQVRKEEIAEKIQDNLVSEQSKRMDQVTAEKAEKQQNRLAKAKKTGATLVAVGAAAFGGMAVAKSEDNHLKAVDKQNAPLIQQVKDNQEQNAANEYASQMNQLEQEQADASKPVTPPSETTPIDDDAPQHVQ